MQQSVPSVAAAKVLALMQAGDLAALDEAARLWSEELLAVARRRCRLPADADDAVQQALLAASTSMAGIRADGAPLAWLSTLVARTCHRLNQQAERTESLNDDDTEPLPCTCDDPAAVAERHQLSTRVRDAMMTLSRLDRLLVLLSAEGFDGVELSERFDLSHDAVRGRLKRARQHLRELLEGENDDTLYGTRSTEETHPLHRSLP